MDRSSKVALLLARFPGPVTIERTSFYRISDGLIGILLVVGALRYVWVSPSATTIVIALAIVGVAWWIAARPTRWLLDGEGLVTADGARLRWDSIKNIKCVSLRRGALVLFDRIESLDSFRTKMNRHIFKRDDSVWIESGNLFHWELDDLIRTWRERATGNKP